MPRLSYALALVVVLAGSGLGGCGGDTSSDLNEPGEPPFPDAAGIYDLRGRFDRGVPGDTITGTLRLEQPTRESGALTGTITLNMILNGESVSLPESPVDNPSVTPDGGLTFSLSTLSTGAFWTFNGTLSGDVVTGRHTLRLDKGNLAGPWRADRVSR